MQLQTVSPAQPLQPLDIKAVGEALRAEIDFRDLGATSEKSKGQREFLFQRFVGCGDVIVVGSHRFNPSAFAVLEPGTGGHVRDHDRERNHGDLDHQHVQHCSISFC